MEDFVWEAPEYFHRQKTSDWFWSLAIVTVTLVIISFVYGNILFGVFLAVASFTLALFAHRPPRQVVVQISSRGIIVDKTLYHYSDLESFWVRENDLHPKILIKSKKTLMPFIVVPLGEEIHPDDIRDYLLGYVKEVVLEEPAIQRLMEYFGF